jgi:UDP-glucose 4-epimerase
MQQIILNKTLSNTSECEMKFKDKKVLVTGGAGFIGSHIVDLLVKREAKVTVVDNLSTGFITNLNQSCKQIIFENVDLLDAKQIGKIVKNNQIVFHLAANADVPRSVKQPKYDFDNNIIGSFNLLKSAIDAKVEKFIFASSAAVYGNPVYTPIDEKHPTNPISPYGASKLAIEHLGRAYLNTYGLQFVTMRIFNTYGERQPRYVMYDLLKKLYKNNTSLEVLGTGRQLRDYSYVFDTAKAFVLAAEKGNGGDIYNIASGKPISICDVVTHILETLELKNIQVTYTNKSWEGDISVLAASIEKIESELLFNPSVNLPTGIKRLHEYLVAKQ